MATELSTFPKRRPPGQRYPWDEWTNGRPWQIMRGEDYDISTENMRTNLHMRASSIGRTVKTQKITDDQEGAHTRRKLDVDRIKLLQYNIVPSPNPFKTVVISADR